MSEHTPAHNNDHSHHAFGASQFLKNTALVLVIILLLVMLWPTLMGGLAEGVADFNREVRERESADTREPAEVRAPPATPSAPVVHPPQGVMHGEVLIPAPPRYLGTIAGPPGEQPGTVHHAPDGLQYHFLGNVTDDGSR